MVPAHWSISPHTEAEAPLRRAKVVLVLEQYRQRCTVVLVVQEPTSSVVCMKLPAMASGRI